MANKKQAARAAAEAARQEAETQKKKKLLTLAGILAAIGVVICLAVAIFFGGGSSNENAQSSGSEVSGKHYVQIEVQDYGTITAELDADVAPITVANFLKLVNEGFYDGLTFHRIIDGFMIQGGDPLGNGKGGSEETIKGEFSANGVQNDISHVRGVLSMARSSAYNSASSQFFIVHEDSPHLDGTYAAFGYVLSGMEVVDAICQNTPVTDSDGSVAKENQPIITSIKVIDKPE